jgi:hypothetical protein
MKFARFDRQDHQAQATRVQPSVNRPGLSNSIIRQRLDPASLLTLQRLAGNASVARLVELQGGPITGELAIQRQRGGSKPPETVVGTKTHTSNRTLAVIHVTGHASPRWRGAKSSPQADALNARLSETRANAVRTEVERELRAMLPLRDLVFKYDYTPADPTNEPVDVILGSEARGSRQTLGEAGKEGRSSNKAQMRRVEVTVSLHTSSQTDVEQELQHYEQRPADTTDWSIQATGQAGVGLGGKAGGILIQLRNEKTGVIGTYLGEYGGGDFGVEVQFANASWSWSSFKTPSPMSFADFSPARFSIFSVGFNIGIGAQWAKFHWHSFGSDKPVPGAGIQIGGFTAGGIGAGVSEIYGSLYLTGSPTETERVPVRTTKKTSYGSEGVEDTAHRVFFNTGGSDIRPTELASLIAYLSTIAGAWR